MLQSSSILMQICKRMLTDKIIMTCNPTSSIDDKVNNLKILQSIFEERGGILAKVSQICSIEYMSTPLVFTDCKPLKSVETHSSFIEFHEKHKHSYFRDVVVDFNSTRAGSIGQLYKCNSKEFGNVILKFQYDDIRKQYNSDFEVLTFISMFLYGFKNNRLTLVKLKTLMYEELDYSIEIMNNELLCDKWKLDPNYIFPKHIPSLCNDRMITFEYVQGLDLISFIQNSNSAKRNTIGFLLFRFVFLTLFKHNTIYSDIHYGNFLVQDDKLAVVDFGAIYSLDETVVQNLFLLLQACVETSSDDIILQALVRLRILSKKDYVEKHKNLAYTCEWFRLFASPFREGSFHFSSQFQKGHKPDLPKLKFLLLDPEIVMVTRFLFLYDVMCNMDCECNFHAIYKEITAFRYKSRFDAILDI